MTGDDEQMLHDIYGTPDNLVRSISAGYGVKDVRLVVTPNQFEMFKAAGLSEDLMVLNMPVPNMPVRP